MVLDLGGSRPVRRGRAGERGRPGSGLLYQQVVSYIEQLVSERGLAPGDMLPTHAELARLTGVSRRAARSITLRPRSSIGIGSWRRGI